MFASTDAVASSMPKFCMVVASFAAAASSSTNALTPSTPNATAATPAAAAAPINAGPSILVRLLLSPSTWRPNVPMSFWAMRSGPLNRFRSAAR